ncbi:MAG: Uma2 family endonuclease, partial [Pseudanabaena sp. CAN_BIN31]|nr:Uma2 family endonuclease [Pseudanabaena sp. CAN_BIN31]
MTAQLLTHKFTIQQYHLMYEAGIFPEGDRLELINGEITKMSPIGRKHVSSIIRLVRLIQTKLGDYVMVSAQNSIRLGNNSEPQPDLAILKLRDDFYE